VASLAGGSLPVKIEGLHHYTVSVADLDESVRWFSDVFGFSPVGRPTRRQTGRVCNLQAPGFLLEMFEVPNAGPVPSYAAGPEPDTDLSVSGHKHFALLVDDIAKTVKDLEALNVSVVSLKRVALEGVGNFFAAFITDNTGALMELPEADVTFPATRSGRVLGQGPIPIDRLHHVAINVPDRDRAIRWYSGRLGLTVATTFEVEAIGLRSCMMEGPGFWMEIHSMANSAAVPEERQDPYTDLQTLGNKYFALSVKDAERAAEDLEAAGVVVIAREAEAGVRRVFIRDDQGIVLELIQPAC